MKKPDIHPTATATKRYFEIDLLRGLAVITMIIFHIAFILVFLGDATINVYSGFWLFLARFTQFTFLTLVGVSLALSSRNYKKQAIRAGKILILAMIVTLATYFSTPEYYVRFGILHFIAISILICAPFRNKPKTALALAASTFIIGDLLTLFSTSSLPLIILGFDHINYATVDHFPIFTWLPLPFIGIYLGNQLKKLNPKTNKKHLPPSKAISFLGRHALFIYMVHVPAILLVFKLTKTI